jgi:hypothetical protein
LPVQALDDCPAISKVRDSESLFAEMSCTP